MWAGAGARGRGRGVLRVLCKIHSGGFWGAGGRERAVGVESSWRSSYSYKNDNKSITGLLY